MIKMKTINENSIFIELPKKKYNSYNQINLLDKFVELFFIIFQHFPYTSLNLLIQTYIIIKMKKI